MGLLFYWVTVTLSLTTWQPWLFPSCYARAADADSREEAWASGDCVVDSKSGTCYNNDDSSKEFTLKPDMSILDYLNPQILENPDTLAEMERNLKKGHAVVLENAFQPGFAEHVWEACTSFDDSDWVESYDDLATSRQWYPVGSDYYHLKLRGVKSNADRRVAVLEYANDVMNHDSSKKFIADLSGADVFGNVVRKFPTLYRPGDYTNFHSDMVGTRTLTLVWQLSKDWDPSWGGAFYWTAAKNITNAYRHVKFNSIMMFPVSATSQHAVTPVTPKARDKRLSFTFSFHAGPSTLSFDDPLEELYSTTEARKQLSNGDALTLAFSKMRDPGRNQRMKKLREAVRNEIVIPQFDDEPILVVEKKDDSSETIRDSKNDDASHNDPSFSGGDGFKIEPGSSIVDYLSPNILEDTAALDEIRDKLKKGHLVVIKNAFVHEFAEYVWQDLSRQDFPWTPSLQLGDSVLPGYSKRNSVADDTSTSILNETMDVFNHPETKRFIGDLSGRDCSAQVKANAELYGPGDYAGPDNNWRDDHTVTFLWSLTKKEEPKGMGGSFYWMAARSPFAANQDMSFNTLFLFNVGATTSSHAVLATPPDYEREVLSLSGHFTATIRTTSVNDPIEEWYGTKEDRAGISAAESEKIVNDLNPEAVDDVTRRQQLIEIQTAVRNEVLAPEFEDEIYVWRG